MGTTRTGFSPTEKNLPLNFNWLTLTTIEKPQLATSAMRCPAAQNAATTSSDDSSKSATRSLLIAPKGGRPKQFTAEQARERSNKASRVSRKRKAEAHAALVVSESEKKAKEDLAQSRADNVKLTGILVQAAAEIRRLRGLLADRQVDAMVTALGA